TGGSLALRSDTVQQTAGGSAPAIAINGGTADLGTASNPGGNRVVVQGGTPLLDNESGNVLSAVGNTFQANGTTLTQNFQIADRIIGSGTVTLAPNTVFVSSADSIQQAIDAATPGEAIDVQTGTHADYVVGSKALTIQFENGPAISLDASGGLTV